MGGRSAATSRQTNTTVLPAQQQQNVDLLLRGARDQYATGGPKFFPGQTYAGPTQAELMSRGMATGYAGGVGQDFVNQAIAGDQFWLNPQNIFNPQNIPGFQNSQDDITRRVTQNLTEGILPQLRSGSIATGTLGGSRQGIGEALAVGRSSEELSGALARMNMDAYGQGLGMYNAAAARAPQTYALGLAPAETLGLVGGQQRADEQQAIDAELQRYNFDQMRPLMNLQTLQALTGSAGQYGGTTTSSGTQGTAGGDGTAQAMQIIGTAIMLFAMSDRRLKTAIKPIGKGLKGLMMYAYRYLWDDPEISRIGYMADEVAAKYPSCVNQFNGYSYVDYGKLAYIGD